MKRIMIGWWLALILTACSPTAITYSTPSAATVDPFVAVELAQRTAEAAQADAEFYGRQLTATAQAPIVSITETAAAFAMEQQRAAATSQASLMTETAAITQTAQSWTATPAPTSTPNLTATMAVLELSATAQVMANNVEKNNLSVKRAQTTNFMRAMAVYVVGFIALIWALMAGVAFAKRYAVMPVPQDEFGKPQAMIDVVEGVLVSANRLTNGTGSIRHADLKSLPAITAERQDATTNRDQLVDLSRAHLPKRLVDAQSRGALSAPSVEPTIQTTLDSFPLPSWDQLAGYPFKAGGEFPFGAFAQELARINVNINPHIGLIGPTGCGKSRKFLRPFIASALASGNRVIVLGDMVDFIVFRTHPNVTLVPVYQITKPEDAAQYVNALKVINDEMERRFRQLASQNLSTWERSGGENTLIVLDELGPNLDILDETNTQAARALRGFLSILISKGRKAGFNFVFASTRAVGLKKQLSQVSTIAFRVKDTDEERYAFGQSGFGADQLPDSYFLSKIGSDVRMTGSFNPSDQELSEFLSRHSATNKPMDKPRWIEGVFGPQLDLPNTDMPLIDPTNAEMHIEEAREQAGEILHILDLHAHGKHPSTIVREVWGITDGGPWRKKKLYVEQVIREHTTTTTTAPNMPEIGGFSPLAA